MKIDGTEAPADAQLDCAAVPPSARYDQIGAYGIILDATGRMLLVQAGSGRFYLPGGRIEGEETPDQALVREIAEECGCAAVPGTILGAFLQPIFGGRVLLLATYWRAELGDKLHDRPECRMVWATRDEAPRLLHRRADGEILARLPALTG